MEVVPTKVDHIAAMQYSGPTSPNSQAMMHSDQLLSPFHESAPPYSPPVEEKIAYDPSAAVARQRSQKDHSPVFNDWDAPGPMDRKIQPSPSQGSSTTPELTKVPPSTNHIPPFHHHDDDPRSGLNAPEPVLVSGLPEVVDMSLRRQTMASTIRGPQPYSPNYDGMSMAASAFLTVTPLHLLGDQPDMIDCPFCLRRTETKVIREASPVTHVLASVCCLTTGLGVFAPYMLDWASHIEQHCTNCNRRVTRKQHGKPEVQVYGTPAEQRMPSRYPAAEFPLEEEVPPPPPAKNYLSPNDVQNGREF